MNLLTCPCSFDQWTIQTTILFLTMNYSYICSGLSCHCHIFQDLEQLKIIAELNHLEELTLVGNPICRTRTEYSVVLGYIPWMNIYVIPSDSDDEVEDDDEEFDFTSPTRIIELI